MGNGIKQKELLSGTKKIVQETIDNVIKSKTFKCSIYLLKYIYDKDEEYFNKFVAMFKELTPKEQMQVMINVRANLVEQGKLKGTEKEKKR